MIRDYDQPSNKNDEFSTAFNDSQHNTRSVRPGTGITGISVIERVNSETLEDLEEQSFFQKKEGNQMFFCFAADGSHHSNFAFDVLVKEFLKKNKMLAIYIHNSKWEDVVNYRNKKDVVISNFESKLAGLPSEGTCFLKEDREDYKVHPLHQINKIGYKYKANYLVCGYNGMKGPRGDNQELSSGVNYLLSQSRMLNVLIKEKSLRNDKDRVRNGFKWLFVFDRASSNCYQILSFLSLINPRDTVEGLTLLPPNVKYDDIKHEFFKHLDSVSLDKENSSYEAVEYTKNPSKQVTSKVNFGETIYDFVVFYNNPEKHKVQMDDLGLSEAATIVMRTKANVCFLNGGLCRNVEEMIQHL